MQRLIAAFAFFVLATMTGQRLGAVSLEHWEYRLPSSIGEDLLSVVHDGQRFLAVGTGGLMLSSVDGSNWADVTPRQEDGTHKARIMRAEFVNGVWFTFGSQWFGFYSAPFVSLDGVNWNFPVGGSSRVPLDVVYINNEYVWIVSPAFFQRGASPLAPGPDIDGVPFGFYQSVARSNSRAVVVGDNGFISYSDNGTSWIAATSGTTRSLRDVEYLDDAFFAVGDGEVILRSPDGVTWTKVNENTDQYPPSLSGIARLGNQWIAVGQRALQSTNGTTWTPTSGIPSTAVCRDVAAGAGRWVIVGDGGLRLTSEDAIAWTGTVPDPLRIFTGLATNGTTVVTASSGGGRMFSHDGVTWRTSTVSGPSNVSEVVWFKDYYYAGGQNGLNLRSVTGESWEAYASPVAAAMEFVGAAGGKMYVSFGNGEQRYTTDGGTWNPLNIPANAWIRSVAFGNNVYVLTTLAAQVFTSPDGVTWTQVDTGFTPFQEVAFGNGRFVAIIGSTSSDTLAFQHSTDGVAWQPVNLPFGIERRGPIIFTGDEFVAGGWGGQIAWSADGISWQKRFTPVSGDFYRLVAFKNSLVATTQFQQLVQSRAAPPERGLANISARAPLLAGDDSLIAGFFIEDGSKTLLVRAIGPSLPERNRLSDPRIQLFRGSDEIGQNDTWGLFPDQPRLAEVSNSVFAFRPTDGSADAAMVADLTDGGVTSVIKNLDQTAGIALAEVYDADLAAPANAGRLINLSARGTVLTTDRIMIAGFVIHAGNPAKVLVRAIGPGLKQFGVNSVLEDPQLTVFAAQNVFATNDDWGDIANPAHTAFLSVDCGAFALPSGSADAALVLYLKPGIYTAHVTGANGATGTSLVEVYLLD